MSVSFICTYAQSAVPGHRCSGNPQEFRVMYFAGRDVKARSMGLDKKV